MKLNQRYLCLKMYTFLKTACMDKDDQIMSIGDAIDKYLSNDYTIQSKVIF